MEKVPSICASGLATPIACPAFMHISLPLTEQEPLKFLAHPSGSPCLRTGSIHCPVPLCAGALPASIQGHSSRSSQGGCPSPRSCALVPRAPFGRLATLAGGLGGACPPCLVPATLGEA